MVATADAGLRRDIPRWISRIIPALEREDAGAALRHVRSIGGHSNDIFELTFDNGRTLLLKRGRHDWAAQSFAASAAAARLVSTQSDIVVPQPLALSCDPVDVHVQAYWRIELPTLARLWPDLGTGARSAALRSLGALLRRLHAVEAPGWGPLHVQEPAQSVAEDLDRDLRVRLLPAVIAHWPEGIAAMERLIGAIPVVERLHSGRPPALVHADLHLGNVLCRIEDDRVECVGLLDLDGAAGGAPESDIAGFDVLHSPLFQRAIDPSLRQHVRAGYGERLSARLSDYYRCAHLANQGFSSALLDHSEHATAIAAELGSRLRLLTPRSRPSLQGSTRLALTRRLGTGSNSPRAAATGALPRSG